ncbi:MAG TPA: hypothetical protein VGZ02_01095 [Candidatus Baltobacteraceae bacterium]|nr:hypothetical protein [Candidatus Baltobacteraceae bacterium]
MVHSGSSRKLTAFIAERTPDVFAVSEIQPGDALAIATRFARQWAYRGRQALFWNARLTPVEIVDQYLPPAAFANRRGLIVVRGSIDGRACSVAVTHLHAARSRRIPELRFLRTMLRSQSGPAVLFASLPPGRIGVRDLGFREARAQTPEVWIREFESGAVCAGALKV